MIPAIHKLEPGKKLYFASDFHLGTPDTESSRQREKKILNWIDSIEHSTAALFILGDIFDFWFEYKYAIPKGFIRLQSKLVQLRDKGISVYFFTGNHDMWMFDYFPSELDIPVFKEPQILKVGEKRLLIGHGDGLGPGDHIYKMLKKIFANRLCQLCFRLLPSDIGMGLANFWSRNSRLSNQKKDEKFLGEKEWLYQFCMEKEKTEHFDFYVFGHRHLPIDMKIGNNSRYINLAEWVNFSYYGEFDGSNFYLKSFE